MKTSAFVAALAATASRFAGLVETSQNAAWNNPRTAGPDKELSDLLLKEMRKVSGWTPGAPYCAAFDGAMVNLTLDALGFPAAGEVFLKAWGAHCMTNVRRLEKMKMLDEQPADGCLMLMRHGGTDNGHAAIVVDVDGEYPNRNLATVEGNTSAGSAGSQRQGDGIYTRVRNVRQNGNLITQGFLHPANILRLAGITPEG